MTTFFHGRHRLATASLAAALALTGLMSFFLIPALGLAYFPRTDPGQFVINLTIR